MPIYQYKCNVCHNDEEYLVKQTDQPPPCKQCGTTDQTKQVTSGAFCLMGYGWSKNGMNSRRVDSK